MNNNVDVGYKLAYLVWDTNNADELNHLHDVFVSCMKIRREQFRVMKEIMDRDGLKASFTLIDDRLVDLEER